MTHLAGTGDDGAADATWWFKDGAGRSGPVTTSELRRLAQGSLGPATLVWRNAFGDRWRRLDDALGSSAVAGPPSPEHGRWTEAFEAFEADPDRRQWSWLGLLAIPAYLWLGMWRRALVMVSFIMACDLVFALAEVPPGSRLRYAPVVALASFSVRNLKRDLYRHRVLGETMWRPLVFLARPWACAGLPTLLFVGLVLASMPAEEGTIVAEVAGVWQDDGIDVVADVAGEAKTISVDGRTVRVRLAALDEVRETVVFTDVADPRHTFTFQRNWNEKRDQHTMGLLVDDRLRGNLLFVRPL